MRLVKTLIRQNAKALAAFVASLIAFLIMKAVGVDLPQDVELAISSVVIAIIVWLVPNEQA